MHILKCSTIELSNSDLYNKVLGLEQRRRIELLVLMYKKTKDVTMHGFFLGILGGVLNTDSKEGTLYKRSPYYV